MSIILAGVSREKYPNVGGQDQEVVPQSEKGARLGRAYLSERRIFSRQVPFCLDLAGPLPLSAPVGFGNQLVQASLGHERGHGPRKGSGLAIKHCR